MRLDIETGFKVSSEGLGWDGDLGSTLGLQMLGLQLDADFQNDLLFSTSSTDVLIQGMINSYTAS